MGFEKQLNTNETKLVDGLMGETLEAIKSGNAVPLPEFLKESPAAKAAFKEALENSGKLRKSLDLLTPEERLAFIKIFSEALEKGDASSLDAAIVSFAATTVVGTAAYVAFSDTSASTPIAFSLAIIFGVNSACNIISDKMQRRKLKDLIISTVSS